MDNLLHSNLMIQLSESGLLNQRLDAIVAEKALLLKQLNELEMQEERIKYALKIMHDVCRLGGQPIAAAVSSVAIASRKTLKQIITDVLGYNSGMTSCSIADTVEEMLSPVTVKRDSIFSTLSRMTSNANCPVYRVDKLYFLVKKDISNKCNSPLDC